MTFVSEGRPLQPASGSILIQEHLPVAIKLVSYMAWYSFEKYTSVYWERSRSRLFDRCNRPLESNFDLSVTFEMFKPTTSNHC